MRTLEDAVNQFAYHPGTPAVTGTYDQLREGDRHVAAYLANNNDGLACWAQSPEDDFRCTRAAGHSPGRHVAGDGDRIVETWS